MAAVQATYRITLNTHTWIQLWLDRMTDHMSREIHLHTPLPRTHTYPPPHNPASPESLQTGDILCCIWFEIISYNRWVLFPEPASQPRTAPRALVAAKTRKLPTPREWSNSHRSAHQCRRRRRTRHSTGTGFFPQIPVGVCFTSCALLGWGISACVCFLIVVCAAGLRRAEGAMCGAAATGRQQFGCTM